MKTTVDIPDDLYGQARKLAAARGQQIAALITEGLEKLIVAQPLHPAGKSTRSGKSAHASLPPKASRWLTEWRSLGRQRNARTKTKSSAAETISRMRR